MMAWNYFSRHIQPYCSFDNVLLGLQTPLDFKPQGFDPELAAESWINKLLMYFQQIYACCYKKLAEYP